MSVEVIGRKWKADFGKFAFQLEFHSGVSMSFRAVERDGSLGAPTTVDITRTELRSDLWLVSWPEPATGATVVHVQDYENGLVWTHISTFAEKQFSREKGRLTGWSEGK